MRGFYIECLHIWLQQIIYKMASYMIVQDTKQDMCIQTENILICYNYRYL